VKGLARKGGTIFESTTGDAVCGQNEAEAYVPEGKVIFKGEGGPGSLNLAEDDGSSEAEGKALDRLSF